MAAGMIIKRRRIAMARAAWRLRKCRGAGKPTHHAIWRWHRAAKGKHQ